MRYSNVQEALQTAEKPGKVKKPAPVRERSITANQRRASRSKDLNLLVLRNTINHYLKQNNVPENLQVAGIQWNKKDNRTLRTYLPFLTEEMEIVKPTIEKMIRETIPALASAQKARYGGDSQFTASNWSSTRTMK